MSDELLIAPRWLVPVEPAGVTLEGHAVLVRDGTIALVGPRAEVEAEAPLAARVELPDHVLIPGLVNAHTHAAMTLMRGLADDLPLMRWLEDHIWPAEGRHLSHDFVHDGTLVAIAEMLRGGVTCFNEMYMYPEAAARAAVETGMRAAIGMIALEFPTPYANDAQDYLAKGIAMRDEWSAHPLLSFCLAPHAPYTVSDATFEKIGVLAEQLDVPIHMHVHETLDEVTGAVARNGRRPLERLATLGLLSPRLVAVHAVHLDPGEIEALARHGCHVAHCPTSNLKLASGFAPVAKLLDAGVNVALGTDGAASNNRLDLFEEMRLAALLAKAVGQRADAVPAHQALAMATLHGARALGIDARIGSIAPGKAADLVAVNLGSLELSPCYDPVSHLVYAAGRHDVSHVWIDGRPKLVDRHLVGIDTDALRARAARWSAQLRPLH